jgi:hypothetical protein
MGLHPEDGGSDVATLQRGWICIYRVWCICSTPSFVGVLGLAGFVSECALWSATSRHKATPRTTLLNTTIFVFNIQRDVVYQALTLYDSLPSLPDTSS